MTDEMIFAVALEKSDPADRAAYVESACAGDAEQYRRVAGLLAAHDRATGFLERPVLAVADPQQTATRNLPVAGAPPGDGNTRTQDETGDDETDDALGFLDPPGRPDSLGRLGHYEVLEVLGRGGFGIVYRAFDDVLQRVVAVKVLVPSMAATSPARKRFVREARSAALIQHENVVRIHETGETPLPYLVMEFIPGETVQDRLDRTGPLEVPEVLRIGRQIADGLAAAHEKGLVHRDIKPSNILIENGPQHQVKITDFGLARAADDASLTRSGTVAGTPMFMAPEQAKGESLDHRADLFSLGSVLYAILTGHPPFRAETTLAVLKRVAEETPRPIREVIPETPAWLCRIVEKLHAKNPGDRYQNAKDVAEVLADCERQLVSYKAVKDYSKIPGKKPHATRARSTWKYGLACLIFLGVLGAWLAPFAWLYANNQGSIRFSNDTDPDVEKVLVLREGVVVATLSRSDSRVSLPPGEYDLNFVCREGYGVGKYTISKSRSYSMNYQFTRPVSSKLVLLNLRRGEAATVKANAERVPPPPPPLSPDQQRKADLAKLRGEWNVKVARIDAKELPAKSGPAMKLIIKDDTQFALQHDGEVRDGTFQLDAARQELLLELPESSHPVRCSYRFDGDRLTLDFPEPRDFKFGNTRPFVPDYRQMSHDNLKKLGLAMHNYASACDSLPPALSRDLKAKDGKPLLSWRVAILPFLEQDAFYGQFKLDEPWDSEHNKKLIARMPKVYEPPGIGYKEPGLTHYQVFVGQQTAFEPRPGNRGIRFADLPDGTSNTILVAESRAPVVWTKPDDLPFDPKVAMPKLGWFSAGTQVLMGDGSVATLLPGARDRDIAALVTRNGGETLPEQVLVWGPSCGPALVLELERGAALKPDPAPAPVPSLESVESVEIRRLQGEWAATYGELEGLRIPLKKLEDSGIRFEGNRFVLDFDENRTTGTFRVEPAIKELVLTASGDSQANPPLRCVYHIEGDQLRLDFGGIRGTRRPGQRVLDRLNSTTCLKQLAIGMHSYADRFQRLPAQATTNIRAKDGKPLLSWRVALLPDIEQQELYEQFKLDEPWDSEHNKALISRMPKIFETPGVKTPTRGMTHYQVFVGPGTIFERRGNGAGWLFDDVKDGLDSTLLIIEGAEPVIWTKPDDLEFDPKKPLPKVGVYAAAIHGAYSNGAVAILPPDIPEATLRALITRNGGEKVSIPAQKLSGEQDIPVILNFKRRTVVPGAGKEPEAASALQPLRDLAAARAKSLELMKQRFKAGVSSKIEVLAAEAEVIESQITLADAAKDLRAVDTNLEQLVKLREEEEGLIRNRVESGVERPEALTQAGVRLAEAKSRLAKRPVPPKSVAPPPKIKK